MKLNSNRSPFKVPNIAWLTLALVFGIVLVWSSALIGSLTGSVASWVAVVLSMVGAFAAFTGLHDASHFALGKKRWLSIVAGELCSIILLANFQIFRQVHNRHHRHTNDPELDPDARLSKGPVWLLPIRWAFVDLHYLREFDRKSLCLTTWERAASWVGALMVIALAAALIGTGHWWQLLFLWILPARISLLCATYYADFVPHQRPRATPKKEHPVRHTANLRGRWWGWVLLGHNLHLIHHLYPAVPFYHCFRIWEERRSELLSRGAIEVNLFKFENVATGVHRGFRSLSKNRSIDGVGNDQNG